MEFGRQWSLFLIGCRYSLRMGGFISSPNLKLHGYMAHAIAPFLGVAYNLLILWPN